MPSPLRPSPLPADVAAVHEGWHRRGRFVTLAEGHRLFVAQEGEGPDLLLVHGFPSTSNAPTICCSSGCAPTAASRST